MKRSAPLTIEIVHDADIAAARRAAKVTAEGVGFASRACEEISLAMTELATNLVKHAQQGKVILTPLADGAGTGLQIESVDDGPGIADVEQAMADGYSTTGSLGTGLGAVNRLMDEFDIKSQFGRGTRIACRKWLRECAVAAQVCSLAFGIATRPCDVGEANGDDFVIQRWGQSTLVGIIDGLGHGQFAHQAARAARQYVENHFDLLLPQIFQGVGLACRATRGVVMALARFDWGKERLAFSSVGNIEVRVFPRSEQPHFAIRRGIIGVNAPKALVTEHPWVPANIMVLHSDGLSTHWGWEDFPGLADMPAAVVAQELLRLLAKKNDDATVIVVRSAIP